MSDYGTITHHAGCYLLTRNQYKNGSVDHYETFVMPSYSHIETFLQHDLESYKEMQSTSFKYTWSITVVNLDAATSNHTYDVGDLETFLNNSTPIA